MRACTEQDGHDLAMDPTQDCRRAKRLQGGRDGQAHGGEYGGRRLFATQPRLNRIRKWSAILAEEVSPLSRVSHPASRKGEVDVNSKRKRSGLNDKQTDRMVRVHHASWYPARQATRRNSTRFSQRANHLGSAPRSRAGPLVACQESKKRRSAVPYLPLRLLESHVNRHVK